MTVAAVARAAVRRTSAIWATLEISALEDSFAAAAPTLFGVVVSAQVVVASQADGYVADALREQGFSATASARVVAPRFAGVASDGRPLSSLLVQPIIQTRVALARGAAGDEALVSGLESLRRIVATQVADAGRVADGVAVTAERRVDGYVRYLSPPSCSRCAVLAGRVYRWNEGFARHPRCDCVHVPRATAEADAVKVDPRRYFTSLSSAEQDRVFTAAGARAIRDGADIGQVVNARRGMAAAGSATTAEAAGRGQRLTPEGIYGIAGDRGEAVRLLRRNGYLI